MLPAVVFAVPLGYAGRPLRAAARVRLDGAAVLVAGAGQAFLEDSWALLALRFLQGIGFGALMPLA